MMRAAFGGILILALAIGATQFIYRATVEFFIRLEDQDPILAGRRLARDWSIPAAECSTAPQTEYQLLARAIFAVETLASGPLERAAENLLVWGSLALGRVPPDFSIGPGQIRRSTAERARSALRADELSVVPLVSREIIQALLKPCEALRIGSLILERDIHAQLDAQGLLPRPEILRAASIWNGQSSHDQGEASLAGLRYRELVYHTFIALRFSVSHLNPKLSDGISDSAIRPHPWRRNL